MLNHWMFSSLRRPFLAALVLGLLGSAGPAAAQIVIDNTSSGFTVGGSWVTSTGVAGYYGTNFAHDNGSGIDTGDWAKWKPTFPTTGSYRVEVRWTAHSNRPDNVKYRIYHQGVLTEVWKNQQVSNGTWVLLGTWTFGAGNSESNRLTIDAGSDSGYVVADAARFTSTSSSTPTPPPSGGACVGCRHKRLKVINGCGQPMWIQYLNGSGGGSLTNPNRYRLGSLGSFIEYDIPDIGIAGVRFWPGMGCDANGHNCTIGASGGPASMGFTCPPHGCGPPVDSKFEATFGCMTGSGCQGNPSGGGAPLGNLDWWNTSAVDGYTLPMQVRAIGNCPVGPQPTGPGGPPGGLTSCSAIRFADCPTTENLSSNGQYPNLSSVNLRLSNPATGGQAGCFSPSSKLTSSQWNAGFTTYPPSDPHAMWYACPTPPISPQQCSSGPANSTKFRNVIHAKCTNTYAYAYDDTFGLATCPAATSMRYEVTYYCPQ
jgi:hypothetical protein